MVDKEQLLVWRAELQRQIEALDVLIGGDAGGSMGVPARPVARPLSATISSGNPVPRPKMLIEAVDEATSAMPGSFNSMDILRHVRAHYPHFNIPTTKSMGGSLATLLKRGKIIYEQKGFGNVPHTYRRAAVMAADGQEET